MVRWNVWLRINAGVYLHVELFHRVRTRWFLCFPWETLRPGIPVFVASAVFQLTSGVWNSRLRSLRFGRYWTCATRSFLKPSCCSLCARNSIIFSSTTLFRTIDVLLNHFFNNSWKRQQFFSSVLNYIVQFWIWCTFQRRGKGSVPTIRTEMTFRDTGTVEFINKTLHFEYKP